MSASEQHQPRARILLAEDNLVNQAVALRMLHRLGYQPAVAEHGLAVLDALLAEPFDIILMDLQMPMMDGIETARHIRATMPADRQPYIIAMTASALDDDRYEARKAGMNDYLCKPVRFASLVTALGCWHPNFEISLQQPMHASPEPQTNPAEVVKHDVLDQLRGLISGSNSNTMDDLIETYIQNAIQCVDIMRTAHGSDAFQQIHRAAHNLASSSGIVGARVLTDLARALERDARNGKNTKYFVTRIDEIATSFETVRAILRTEQQRGGYS